MTYNYPVTIEHIYISPGHNYFGRPKDGPGAHPTHDVAQAEAVAGRGLVGDRYFGVAAHFEAQITFIAAEVLDALRAAFNLPAAEALLARRNIVIRGANINQLIGQDFSLVYPDHQIDFAGSKPCSPCAWMDASFASGALQFLRGRGGLRARILSSGTLQRGPAILRSAIPLDTATIADPIPRPRLP